VIQGCGKTGGNLLRAVRQQRRRAHARLGRRRAGAWPRGQRTRYRPGCSSWHLRRGDLSDWGLGKSCHRGGGEALLVLRDGRRGAWDWRGLGPRGGGGDRPGGSCRTGRRGSAAAGGARPVSVATGGGSQRRSGGHSADAQRRDGLVDRLLSSTE
jgi:hypothetical protein